MSVVVLSSGPPPGSIMLHAGAATNPAPDGWLWCDGAEYHTADYPNLAAACNDMYGSASAGKFRVPNMSGRVAIGSGNDGTTTRNPGETPGAATHTLSLTEMPSHSHGGGTGLTDVNHLHGTDNGQRFGTHVSRQAASGAGAPALDNASNTTNWADRSLNHSHTIGAEGGSGAHNNMQPSAVVGGYIIKT